MLELWLCCVQMSAVLSEWKAAAVVTIAVTLITVQATELWITGNNNCFSPFICYCYVFIYCCDLPLLIYSFDDRFVIKDL